MERSIIKRAAKFLLEHRRRKRRYKIVTGLAMVIVFITVYLLILPAVTAERNAVCGMEEHTHDADCFDDDGAVVCDIPEHIHTESCFESEEEEKTAYSISSFPDDDPMMSEYYYDGDAESKTLYGNSAAEKSESSQNDEYYVTEDPYINDDPETEKYTPENDIPTQEDSVPEEVPSDDNDIYDSTVPDDEITSGSGLTVDDNISGSAVITDNVVSGGSVDIDITDTYSEEYVEEYTETTSEYMYEDENEDKFVCGLTEHLHTGSCYSDKGELVCGFAEHKHDQNCLADTPMLMSIEESFPSNSASFVMEMNPDLSYTLYITGGIGVLNIPSNVMWEGNFKGYSNRVSKVVISLDNGMVHINRCAFEGCLSLKEVEFNKPMSVSIEGAAFSNCINLEKFDFEDADITDLRDDDRTGDINNMASAGAFYNTALKEVNFSSNPLYGIGDFTFYGCKNLERVHFATDQCPYIGMGAFQNCESLKDINLEDIGKDNLSINSVVFYGYRDNTVNNVVVGTFKGCTSLKRIKMPSVRYFFYNQIGGSGMFYGCTALESVDMGENAEITQLGTHCMFMNTPSLKEIDLTGLSKLERICDKAFYSSGIRTIKLPASVKTITSSAFQNCVNLKTIDLPKDSKLETIEGYAFADCVSLTELDFSNLSSLKTIQNRAFINCGLIKTIKLPPTVETLKDCAFQNMAGLSGFYMDSENLKNVTNDLFLNTHTDFILTLGKDSGIINSNFLTAVAEKIGRLVFEGPNEFEISGTANTKLIKPLDTLEGRYYASAEGDLYKITGADEAALVYVNSDRAGEFVLPENIGETGEYTVSAIGDYAFKDSGVTSVVFENINNIKTVGFHSFAECMGLESVGGKTTVSEIIDLFTSNGVSVRESAFYMTALEGKPDEDTPDEEFFGEVTEEEISLMDGDFEVFAQKGTQPEGNYLTGEDHKVTVNISEKGSGNMLRLYFRCTSDCTYLTNVAEMSGVPIKEVSIAGTDYHYYEIGPAPSGQTLPITLTFNYPNGKPDNSTLYMWAVGGNKDSFNEKEGQLILPTDDFKADGISTDGKYFKSVWKTIAYHYPIKKTNNNDSTSGKAKTAVITGARDGKKTVSNLSYWIRYENDDKIMNQSIEDPSKSMGGNWNYGSDYIKYIEYEDILTLPEHVSWREGVKEAIESGNFRYEQDSNKYVAVYVTIDDAEYKLVTLERNSGVVLAGASIKTNDEGSPVVRWTMYNANTENKWEISSISLNIVFGSEVLIFDEEGYKAENGDKIPSPLNLKFKNNIKVVENYFYDKPYESTYEEEKEIPIFATAGKVDLKKERTNEYDLHDWDGRKYFYFGEDAYYRITASNTEFFDYYDMKQVKDDLDKYHYIKPSNMEKMFAEAARDGNRLEITINNGAVSRDSHFDEVTLIDGKTKAKLNSQYVGTGTGTDEADYMQYYKNDPDIKSTNAEIKISESDGVYTVTYDGKDYKAGADMEYADIKAVFDELGFIVTEPCTYSVCWYTDGLPGASEKEFNIYSTFKDSFMLLVDDRNEYYGNTEDVEGGRGKDFGDVVIQNMKNSAYACRDDGTKIVTAAVKNDPTVDIRPEITIQKGASIANKEGDLGNDFEFNDDTLWDNHIILSHYSNSGYDVMPVVDYMTGITAILAPVSDNKNASWTTGLKTYRDRDGKSYYVLMPEAEHGSKKIFKGVKFGEHYADSVTVTRLDDGLIETVTKWYIKDYLGANFTDTIEYKSYSSLETLEYNTSTEAERETARKLRTYNRAWIGDRLSHRLTDYKGGYMFNLKFDKNIVTEKGTRPALDILDDDGFSRITQENNTVTYRLEFRNESEIAQKLLSTEFQDILPKNDGFFEWKYGENVTVSYEYYGEGVKFYNGDTELETGVVSDGNELKITGKDDVTGTDTDKTQQYLRWNSGFRVEFPENKDNILPYSGAYIYVTLKFPGETPEEWNEYLTTHGTGLLSNTLEAWDYPKTVTHELSDPGNAFLQKGVYETGMYTMRDAKRSAETGKPYVASYYRGQDRFTYRNNIMAENTALSRGTVAYYIIIKNTSNARLYLSTIYDCLPKGFELLSLRNNPDAPSWAGVGCTENIKDGKVNTCILRDGTRALIAAAESGNSVKSSSDLYVSVSSMEEKNGHTIVGFQIERKGTANDLGVGYDEQMGKAYLEPGYYLQFGYECLTGAAEETEDTAVNAAAMMITDTQQEFTLDRETKVKVSDSNGFTPNNDGDRYIWDNTEARKYGFTEGKSSTKWLASDVTVYRGSEVVPGIEKHVTSTGGSTDTGRNVSQNNTVTWNVKNYNDGTAVIDGYTFTDTLDFPQYFAGEVTYESYSQSNYVSKWTGSSPENGRLVWASNGSNNYLFKFGEWKKNSAGEFASVDITTNRNLKVPFSEDDVKNGTYKDVYFDLSYGNNSRMNMRPAQIALKKSETGTSMTLSIKFPENQGWGIVPYGYVGMTLKSSNITGVYNPNPGIYNTAVFTPDDEYDEGMVTKGENIRKDGKNAGVMAVDYVVSDVAYPTESENEIYDTEITENQGIGSDQSNNKIVIKDKTKPVEYTLTVKNSKSKAMNWLVLIDNLPEPEDSNTIAQNMSRGSEFKLSLYNDPSFNIVITTESGETISLTKDDYKIQYSKKTVFDRSENSDWKPDGGVDWTDYDPDTFAGLGDDDRNTIRSVRLVITKEIPAGAVVTFSYKAVVDETNASVEGGDDFVAKPGETAWNTFGYQYEITDDPIKEGEEGIKRQLFATPLKVGVSIPTEPSLIKQLINKQGKPIEATEDSSFEYIIYDGEEISFDSGYAPAAVAEKLIDRKYTYVKLDVDKGSSSSAETALSGDILYVYGYDPTKGFEPTADKWAWDFSYDATGELIQEKYNIVELESESNKVYGFYSSTVGTTKTRERSRSFMYNPETNVAVKFENMRDNWGLSVTKVNESGSEVLADAVFGLYSPDVKDRLSDADITNSGFEPSEVSVIEFSEKSDEAKIPYYLSRIETTDSIGSISLSDILIYDTYLLKELKAPDGYYVNAEGGESGENYNRFGDIYKLTYPAAADKTIKLEIVNYKGAALPGTGGYGLKKFVMTIGLVSIILSAVLLTALKHSKKH